MRYFNTNDNCTAKLSERVNQELGMDRLKWNKLK